MQLMPPLLLKWYSSSSAVPGRGLQACEGGSDRPVKRCLSWTCAFSGELLELQCKRGAGFRDGPGGEGGAPAVWEVARGALLRRPSLCQVRLEARYFKGTSGLLRGAGM